MNKQQPPKFIAEAKTEEEAAKAIEYVMQLREAVSNNINVILSCNKEDKQIIETCFEALEHINREINGEEEDVKLAIFLGLSVFAPLKAHLDGLEMQYLYEMDEKKLLDFVSKKSYNSSLGN